MSKPNREAQLRLGEQRLQEWGLPADATVDALRAVVGRDAAADLAIAVTGEPLNPRYLLRHLTEKLGTLYGL